MIIRIEDAPNIKNIKIDIAFDDDGSVQTQTISSNADKSEKSNTPDKNNKQAEVDLDLDEDFNVSEEVIELPTIPDVKREVNVASDMTDAEF